jgi:hypothetical protein
LGGGYIGEMQRVFNARDKTHTYQQGVELMEESNARYIQTLAMNPNNVGLARNDHLTIAGFSKVSRKNKLFK